MIEISHQQARRLLREHADRSLPEAQWMMLQAHLERCPECRLYRDRLDSLETHLRRAMHTRWHSADGLTSNAGAAVLLGRREREKNRQFAVYGSLGLMVVIGMLILGLGFIRRAYAPVALNQTITPTVNLSMPTLSPGQRFQGVVLFQTAEKTLNVLTGGPGGADFERLTSDTYQDTDPSWSLDGEWVAFLSNRAQGGKPELFLTNLVGGRVTQITSDPDVTWQGPAVWSPDERWLAIVGRRKFLNNEPWVYLVPIDGTGSRVLPGTRGVAGGLSFIQDDLSPNPNLIFASSLFGSSIVRYDPQTGRSGVLTGEDNQKLGLETGINGAYDYSVQQNHYSLIYLAAQSEAPFGPVHIRSVSFYVNDVARQSSTAELDLATRGTIRSIHYMPGDTRVVYLQDTDSLGCWKVHIRNTQAVVSNATWMKVRQLDGLCITSSIERFSISANGRWLVVFGHLPGDKQEGLYAVEIPAYTRLDASLSFQLLARVSNPIGSPLIRPGVASRGIQPKPVQEVTSVDKPSKAPGGMEGLLVLSVWPETLAGEPQKLPFGIPRSGVILAPDLILPPTTSRIDAGSPDGLALRTLQPAETMNACPVISPDRTKIAFLSDRLNANREGWEIFLMYIDGENTIQLTRRQVFEDIGDPTIRYDCPVFSPDGKYLATIRHSAFSTRLVVIAMNDGSEVVRSAIIDNPSMFSGLIWSADGKQIYLVEAARLPGPLRVIDYPWLQPTGPYEALAIDGWEDAQAFSISPDGSQMALILAGSQGEQLRVYSLSGPKLLYKKDMPNAETSAQVRPGRIFWMAENQIAFIYQYRPYERYKSAVVRYSPEDDTISYLVQSEDRLYDWALNGSWLVYSTESGVWGIEVNGRFDRHVTPIRLSSSIAYDLDWR